MSHVKTVALQVVSALPEDADFSDLDEFLYERAMVEAGRDAIGAGRTSSPGEVAPALVSGATVTWSEPATEAFLEALRTSHATSVDESRGFAATVGAAIDSLAAAPGAGRSLPEMGDPSILEVPVVTPRISYRLIYDVQDGIVRILCFANGFTCYRNARPE